MKKLEFLNRVSSIFESIFRLIFIKLIYLKKLRKIDSPQTILLWSPGGGGWPLLANLEMVLAAGLKMRGHTVKAIIHDNTYKAYSNLDLSKDIDSKENFKVSKLNLKSNKRKLFEFGIEYYLFGDYLKISDKKLAKEISQKLNYSDLDNFKFSGVSVGKNIKASLIRYLKGKDFTKQYQKILNEYAYAGILNIIVAEKVISSINPNRVFMSHGIYADWGPAMKCFIKNSIPTATYASGYKNGFFNFKHIKNPNKVQVLACEKDTWNKMNNTNLIAFQKNKVNNFLLDRYFKNSCADIKFDKTDSMDLFEFKKRYGIENENRPIWSIFTHITWDASNENSPQIYPDFTIWLEKTIDFIRNNKEVFWLIKIHPADLKNPSPYSLTNRIKKLNLPPHIKVIEAKDNINPFYFLEILDGGITSVGTSGLELALKGKPVILAGESHYSGKSFTIDCKEENEYLSQIMNAHKIKKLSPKQVETAYKYAYLFLFRKQIKLPILLDKNGNYWSIKNNKLFDIIPDYEPNLSFICDSFLNDKDFVL